MIKFELLSKHNFDEYALDTYERKQEVNKVYRMQNGEYELIDCPYTEDWDLNKKRTVAKEISSDEYITYLAIDNNKNGFHSFWKVVQTRSRLLITGWNEMCCLQSR